MVLTLLASVGCAATPQTSGEAVDGGRAPDLAEASTGHSVPSSPITIVTKTIPAGVVGTPYSASFAATSTAGRIVGWQTVNSSGAAIAYQVPAPGLQWGGNLTITGTPTEVGSTTFVFKVTDSANHSITTGPYPLVITSTPQPGAPQDAGSGGEQDAGIAPGADAGAAGDFGKRLGMFDGNPNGISQGSGPQTGVLAGFTPPLYSDYAWGISGAINHASNGVSEVCANAVAIGDKLMVGFPVSGGVDGATATFAQVVAGQRDDDATYFAQTLISGGCADAVIRMGWEGNQANAGSDPSGYVAAVQHLVTLMRGISGQKFRFCFNLAMDVTTTAEAAASMYPGDAYIDVVALDFYDNYGYTTSGGPGAPGSAYPGIDVAWPWYVNQPIGLTWLASFATAHGKKVAFCEWGLGWSSQWAAPGGDNGAFATNTANWAMAHADIVEWVVIWDSGTSMVSTNPNFKAALVAALNTPPGQ